MNIHTFSKTIGNSFQSSQHLVSDIVISIIVIIALWLIRLLVIRAINRNIDDSRRRYRWRKNASYAAGLIGLVVLGAVWFKGLQSIGTFLGLLSAGLAIALRDPLTDMAGWIYINLRSPFNVGDRVQIGEVKGDIIDIRLIKFTVLEIGNWIHSDQSTGRVVHVPNHRVFSEPVANYTSDFEFIWNELEVLVTFESNWKKAKKRLQEIADKHLEDFTEKAQKQVQRANKSYLVHYKYLTPIVYTDIKDSGINLTIRHLCNPRHRRSIGQAIWEDILDMVEQADDIAFAYPTMRITNDSGNDEK